MLIKLTQSAADITVLFDHKGHVYFELANKYYLNTQNCNSVYYDVAIDNKNVLTVDQINLDVEETVPDTGTLKLSSLESSLKGKAIREQQKLDDEHRIELGGTDSDTEEPEDVQYNQYYYEDNLYFEDFNDDPDNTDEKEQKVFFLNSGSTKVKIIKGDNDASVSLYDTILYTGSLTNASTDTSLTPPTPIFKTRLSNDLPVYRLRIYNSGEVAFRPIGTPEQKYKLEIIDDKLTIKLVS